MKTKKLTLLELIITILVLGLLTALAMPQFIGVKADADVASFKNDIDVLHKAVDEMYVREDKLPLGDSVDKSKLDAKLLNVVYASGDSGNHLYKIDLSQSKKYHYALKTNVTEDDFFFYSKETGKIFYTKGMIDGDNKTLYTMEYIGLSNLKIGANALINGAKVPVDSPLQTIEGQVPVDSDVSVSINGTPTTVTYEDVTFDGSVNIMAGTKMKKFTSEVLLTQNKNVLTIKKDNTVTNFTIYLGDSEGGETIPEVPVIKPVAVISMTPEQGLTTSTNIVWGYENSTAAEGRTITNAEWEGKQDLYSTEGTYTVRLRVQDSTGSWSDWVEKSFSVFSTYGIRQVAAGENHSIVLKKDGTVWASGRNNYGQLGTGDTVDRDSFVQVASNVKSIATGFNFSFIIKDDNTLWATGQNSSGQLGSGDNNNKTIFTQITTDVKSITGGLNHSLLIKMDGTFLATGSNSAGQLGLGDTSSRNYFVQAETNVKSAIAGGNHSVIIKNDGTLWTSGFNSNGELGNGSKSNSNIFTQSSSNVVDIAAGYNHTLILKENGTLWATGRNDFGQLGTGNSIQKSSFTQITSGVKRLSAGGHSSLILKEDNTLWASGYNYYGQLGSGNTNNSNTFIKVAKNVEHIGSGYFHSVVSKNDGTICVSGYNYYGQLGTGDKINRITFDSIE